MELSCRGSPDNQNRCWDGAFWRNSAVSHKRSLTIGPFGGIHGPTPHMSALLAARPATNCADHRASSGIGLDLAQLMSTVTCFCPGATATKFASRADMEKSRLFKLGTMNSKDVARAAYKGMMAGNTMVIPGFFNKALAMSVRFSPRMLITVISRSLQEPAK